MKSAIAIGLLLTACTTGVMSVDVTGPTILAYVDSRRMTQEEIDSAVDDFVHYLPAARETAKKLGARFVLVEQQSFRVGSRTVDTTLEAPLGFVLIAPGREPLILGGVQTDSDFTHLADEYFARRPAQIPNG